MGEETQSVEWPNDLWISTRDTRSAEARGRAGEESREDQIIGSVMFGYLMQHTAEMPDWALKICLILLAALGIILATLLVLAWFQKDKK